MKKIDIEDLEKLIGIEVDEYNHSYVEPYELEEILERIIENQNEIIDLINTSPTKHEQTN